MQNKKELCKFMYQFRKHKNSFDFFCTDDARIIKIVFFFDTEGCKNFRVTLKKKKPSQNASASLLKFCSEIFKLEHIFLFFYENYSEKKILQTSKTKKKKLKNKDKTNKKKI